MAKDATRTAEKGVGQARDAAGEAARAAEKGVVRTADKARAGLSDAREHFEVDAKVEGAKQSFGVAMDEAAEDFAALAESGQAHGEALAGKLGGSSRVLAVAPGSVVCDPGAQPPVCKVDPELLEVLRESPMSLARDALLKPKRGKTGAGLELARVSAKGFTRALGLREGDILLELNGVKLDSFEAIGALDEALAGQHLVTLIYERASKRQTLTMVRQVAPSPR